MKVTTGVRRAVLYARVSQARHETKSVHDQLAELRASMAREGWTIVAEHSDEVSASRFTTKVRQGWTSVMETIAAGDVDTLAVWELSRASRDRPVVAALLAACIESGVTIYTGGRLHDPTDADDAFVLDLGGALAVRESAMTSKRTQRSVDARAAAGRPHGSVPFGYRRVLDPNTGRAVGREIHPEQGPVVQEVVRRLLGRESAVSIAKDLTNRGVLTPSGTPWRSGNLSTMALRPTYAGLRTYRGEVLADVTATWPPLITMAEREQLLAMYSDAGRDKFRVDTHVRHLGSGIFRCGREGCDGVMRVVVQNGNRPQAYSCRDCYRVSRNQQLVDDQVEKLIVARLSRKDVLELLADTGNDADVKAAAAEVAELKAQLRTAREKVTSGQLNLDDFSFFRATWEPKLADAEQRARPRWLPPAVFDVAGPDAAEKWQRQTPAGKRSILAALFEVMIMPAGRRGAPFDPNLISVAWRGARS